MRSFEKQLIWNSSFQVKYILCINLSTQVKCVLEIMWYVKQSTILGLGDTDLFHYQWRITPPSFFTLMYFFVFTQKKSKVTPFAQQS